MIEPTEIGWYLVVAVFAPVSTDTDLGAKAEVPLIAWYNPAATPRWWVGHPGECLPWEKVWGRKPNIVACELLPPSMQRAVENITRKTQKQYCQA